MKAVTWCGKKDMRVQNVPDPKILNPRDAILKVTTTAICGSDLHFYDGYIPTMQAGDIVGHEFMGEVVELGAEVRNLKKGDRVVVPFTIACGNCFFCKNNFWSACDNSNPNAWMLEKAYGYSGSGLFGYSHMYGGYAGGQAEYVRVPFADVGPLKIPDGLPDEKVIFLTDIFPTGYMAAENCDIEPGDTVAVWGCGPVGQFAIRSAFLLGAERVIAIDDVPERLRMAEQGKAVTLNMADEYIYDKLRELTGGRGPDSCIDAVGLEAHGMTLDAMYDLAKAKVGLATDRPHALRQAINCLPEVRHRLRSRRLRRVPRQVPVRRRLRQGPDLQDGPDPRSQVPPQPARPRAKGRNRPVLCHHPYPPADRRREGLQDVQRKEGPVHQGGAETLKKGNRQGSVWKETPNVARAARPCFGTKTRAGRPCYLFKQTPPRRIHPPRIDFSPSTDPRGPTPRGSVVIYRRHVSALPTSLLAPA